MMSDIGEFERLVRALAPWRNDLVIVGGWAHRMHYQHPSATRLPYAPILTRDADVAYGARAALEDGIRDALTAASFSETLSGDDTPPVARYHLGEDDQGFYAEFLTPLVGSGTRRDGSEDATERRAGISAQKLRHLELLMVHPWEMTLGNSADPVRFRVANPVSFIVQKLLIHGARKENKRAQDVLYVHDTIQLFASSFRELNGIWRSQLKGALTKSQLSLMESMRGQMFDSLTDALREAARIPQDRVLRAEEIRDVCRMGLQEILQGS